MLTIAETYYSEAPNLLAEIGKQLRIANELKALEIMSHDYTLTTKNRVTEIMRGEGHGQ